MRHFTSFAAIAVLCLVGINLKAETISDGKYTYESVEGDAMKARIYRLPNGLRIYISQNSDQPRIQADIAVRTGSRNDPAETTGLAHYLEHLMFKGTRQFGTIDAEAEAPYLDDIERRYEAYRLLTDPEERRRTYHEIDSISQIAAQWNIPNEYDKLMAMLGSDGSNAFTSYDVTCYVENIPTNEFEKWARVQADRFQNMVIRGFHTELEAVYEEYNIYLAEDGEKMSNALFNKLFPTHPYGTQTTIGTQEHLKNPSITNIKRYFERYYCPNNVAICLSGDIDPDKAIAIIDKYFGGWVPNPACVQPQYAPVAPITTATDTTVVGLEAESLYLGWQCPAASNHANDTIALISEVLSNGVAGLIDLDINQKMAMLDGYAGTYNMTDYGIFIMGGSPLEGQTLEQVRDLLLAEVDKVCKGDFPDELLPAILANMKLHEQKALEHNNARTRRFQKAFVNGIEWKDEVERLARIEHISKADLVDYAKRHLGNNYVCVFKRQAEDPNIKKIDKPEITPIPANRNLTSDFVKEIGNTEVEPIQPQFVNFERDLVQTTTQRGLPLIYKENTENDLFELSFRIPYGQAADRRLSDASDYLDYLGTKRYSAEEIQQRFYALACNFSVNVGPYSTTISLSGLNENLSAALTLAEDVLTNARASNEDYEAYVAAKTKAYADAKLQQRECFDRLRAYGTYGTRNQQTDILTPSDLAQTKPAELVNIIHDLLNHEHTILYYGPSSTEEINRLIKKYHRIPKRLKPSLSFTEYAEQPTHETEVVLAPYDAQNIYMLTYNNEEYSCAHEELPTAALFNEYFGSGMNGIVFQELRESRGLAYSAQARYTALPERKGHPSTSFTYIISQNDKLKECIETFNQILDTIPQSEAAFEIARQSLQKQLASQRTTRSAVLGAWIIAKERGMDGDINERIYQGLPKLKMADIVDFANRHMARKPRRYMILGNEAELDKDVLRSLGPIHHVSLEEIFGY